MRLNNARVESKWFGNKRKAVHETSHKMYLRSFRKWRNDNSKIAFMIDN